MSENEFDISSCLTWEEGLPHPQWDLINTWMETHQAPAAKRVAWVGLVREWLSELGVALGGGYETVESANFLALVPNEEGIGGPLLDFAEQCRLALLTTLQEVTAFDETGKQIVLAIRDPEDYYRYILRFFPEGEFGASTGVHIREGQPHVTLCGRQLWTLQHTLSHELTHVSLLHLSMPQWLEEGLAQMFEHDMLRQADFQIDGDAVSEQKQYWGEHGLDEFWYGTGFSNPSDVQKFSYQLAETLVRLLVEEARPRWFGLVREPQKRFFAFLREAKAIDHGEAASREYLKLSLSDLAAKFLGPGSWAPSLNS